MTKLISQTMDKNMGFEEFGEEAFLEMLANFEKFTLDVRMKQLIEGMLEKDWTKAMVATHTMKGSCGYIYAYSFQESCKEYQEHIKKDCERIEFDQSIPSDPNRLQYRLLPSFDITQQLQAYEYFYPLMDSARALKKEISITTGSQYSPDLWESEVLIIRSIDDKLRFRISRDDLIEPNKFGTSKSIYISKTLKKIPSHMDPITPTIIIIDIPKETKCCDKCNIF